MKGIDKRLIKWIVFSGVFFILGLARPALSNENPVKMLESVTQQVLTELKDNYHEIRHKPHKIYGFIDNLILPHIDFVEMARWVVGRNVWHSSNNAARKIFIEEFRKFLVKNYAQLLLSCASEEIEFYPLREDWRNQRYIQVSSFIKKGNYSAIHMDYHLILQDSQWKVYDILIEGSSMLEGYQAQFLGDLQKGGIEALIEKIKKKNSY